ncbi:hypothetical protein [Sphingomonas mesophila]|uniref:hypothetical protein n=1 Tax=Sphingomonas mesophila TaxID=2303576 RepID=UPI000E57DB26|nr:hypothetical protein [Sphingomonas mesophila]
MRHIDQARLAASDQIAEAPTARSCNDQSFGLPTGIYIAMAVMFVGFVTVLAVAFNGEMAVSYGVIFAFLAMFFGVPSLFPRLAGQDRTRALEWREFVEHGIDTATGRTSAGSATVLVLILPFLILCFAIAVATIAAPA